MARATRSSTADLKRKRSPDPASAADNPDNAPSKLLRTDQPATVLDGSSLLAILDAHDDHGFLDRVFLSHLSDHPASLRSLLSTDSSVNRLRAAIDHLRPISVQRASHTPVAAHQLRFYNLAHALLQQLPPKSPQIDPLSLFDSPQPQRPKPSYALVQHLPSGDWWSSLAADHIAPQDCHTANADLVAVFPTPSTSSSDRPPSTLGSYCPKPAAIKKASLQSRKVTTAAFLDYGPYSSFAPTFDHDGELVGRRELGEVLWYNEEKRWLHQSQTRNDAQRVDPALEDIPSSSESSRTQTGFVADDELEGLLPPEDVAIIKATLNSLDLENSVQELLERNQRALASLAELQRHRMTKHPTSVAEEGSEEWETAQSIAESLSLLLSLRPRTSTESTIIPPAAVLHRLHRTLALDSIPTWWGTLPPSRSTALRDDMTMKVRPGAATPAPTASTATAAPPASTPSTNALGSYPYTYGSQAGYRPPATPYTPLKPGAATSYYQGYGGGGSQQQSYYGQQSYASASTTVSTNQQPYGVASGQQSYSGYSWYPQQYQSAVQSGSGSGRGTPQPLTGQSTPNYGTAFNPSVMATPTAGGSRTPAVANTVVAASPAVAGSSYGQISGTVPTLPIHLRASGAIAGYPMQQSYFQGYQMQTQPAR